MFISKHISDKYKSLNNIYSECIQIIQSYKCFFCGESRLYINPYDTEIYGCYTVCKCNNTKSFTDCFQLNYNPVSGVDPGELYKYDINRNINDKI
ncbi:hypothetical protein PIROE2DRAFT_5740 [Piromyces sp. E2]|nr:hypothetical protein PIROE2DRAFT_5740 [Piromyces sp. E2]|eukprot:OUM66882.1 hypothetical protein PIROE2DRAFT_5740 [Piromyces sp. E2]